MNESNVNLQPIKEFFTKKLHTFGTTPKGVDYHSQTAMDTRFEQLLKIKKHNASFSLIDFGCGYGALADYLLRMGIDCEYFGYDMVTEMISSAQALYHGHKKFHFTSVLSELPNCDYVVESGIFNMRIGNSFEDWTNYVTQTLHQFDQLSLKGFAFNLLTSYSDKEYMDARPDLYYADACFFFDFCKRNFSRNVALLHDYELYDFTIHVRKEE